MLLRDQKTQHPGDPGHRVPRRPWAPLLMPRSPSASAPTGEGMGAIKASERVERCSARPSPAIPCRGRGHRRSRPSPLHPAACGGQSWVGGERGQRPFLQCRAAAGAQRRLHSGFGLPRRRPAGRRRAHPRPLPERAPRGTWRGGAQVSARVRGAGPRPRSWKSVMPGRGASAGAGDARAGGGAGWSRAARLGGRCGVGRTREGATGRPCVEMHVAGARAAPCSVRVGRAAGVGECAGRAGSAQRGAGSAAWPGAG